jgi:hypothetical protein
MFSTPWREAAWKEGVQTAMASARIAKTTAPARGESRRRTSAASAVSAIVLRTKQVAVGR